MTSDVSIDIREVIFINVDARRGYDGLPEAVGETADAAITTLQNGAVPSAPGLWRSLAGNLRGLGEIRIGSGTDTYRVYVWLGCDLAVFVLDAGIKKSSTGSAIPRWQQERLLARRDRAVEFCTANAALLRTRFLQRAERRQGQQGWRRQDA